MSSKIYELMETILKTAGVQLDEDDDFEYIDENDLELDEEQLNEAEDDGSVEFAENQVTAWDRELCFAEHDDTYSANRRIINARDNLMYWKREVEKRKQEQPLQEEDIQEEITPSRLWKYQESDKIDFAIISADRNERTPQENHEKYEQLKQDVKKMGYWYTEIKGGYVEIGENGMEVPVDNENSLLIPNMTKKQAIELGQKYDQDTVMFKDSNDKKLQYIYTNERAGEIGEPDSSFKTQAGKDNFSVTSGTDVPYYSRMVKSTKPNLKIGFIPKD